MAKIPDLHSERIYISLLEQLPRKDVADGDQVPLIFSNVRKLAAGGQAYVFIAEAHLSIASTTQPRFGHVIIKAPHLFSASKSARITVNNTDSLDLEHQIHHKLSDIPHLAMPPEKRLISGDMLSAAIVATQLHYTVESQQSTKFPILITQLSTSVLDPHSTHVPFTLAEVFGQDTLVLGNHGQQPLHKSSKIALHTRGLQNWFELARSLSLAIKGIHRSQHVHGDIKPENTVLHVTNGWWREITLIDLGVASELDDSCIPSDGLLGGTPAHFYPELIDAICRHIEQGNSPATIMSVLRNPEYATRRYAQDLYALGLILCNLLLEIDIGSSQVNDKVHQAERYRLLATYNRQLEQEVRIHAAHDGPIAPLLDLCHRFLLAPIHTPLHSSDSARTEAIKRLHYFYSELEVLGSQLRDGRLGQSKYYAASTNAFVRHNPFRDYSLREALKALTNSFDIMKMYDLARRYRSKGEDAELSRHSTTEAVRMLKAGHGHDAKALFQGIIERTIAGIARLPANELNRSIRLYLGVLLVRDDEFQAVLDEILNLRKWYKSISTSDDDRDIEYAGELDKLNFVWWLDLFQAKAIYHKNPMSFHTPHDLEHLDQVPPGTREQSWHYALRSMYTIRSAEAHNRRVSDDTLQELQSVISNSWSPVEMTVGALGLVRAQIQRDEPTPVILNSLSIAIDISRGSGLPHEFAAALITLANWVKRRTFAKPTPMTSDVDYPRCLEIAANAALAASEIYKRLGVRRRSIDAIDLAARCLARSTFREHVIDAYRLASFFKNSSIFHLNGQAERPARYSDGRHQILQRNLHDRWRTLQWPGTTRSAFPGSDIGAFLARRFYGRYGAGIKDIFSTAPIENNVEQIFETMLGRMASSNCPVFLDVGFGDGNYLIRAIEAGAEKAIGVDAVAPFFPAKDVLENPRVILSQACVSQINAVLEPEHGESSVDLVWCKDILVHVAQKREALQGIASALKPGGSLAIIDPVQRDFFDLNTWNNLMESCLFPGLETVEGYRQILQEEGFRQIEIHDITEEARGRYLAALRYIHKNPHGKAESFITRANKILTAIHDPLQTGVLGWVAITAIKGSSLGVGSSLSRETLIQEDEDVTRVDAQ